MVKANRNFRPAPKHGAGNASLGGTQPRLRAPTPAALRSFLASHVGQSWKSVCDAHRHSFREAEGTERSGSWMTHVATKTSSKQGRIRVHTPDAGMVPLEVAHYEFFVHPELGTLVRNPYYLSQEQKEKERELRRVEELHKRMRHVSPFVQVHRIGAVWYLVELRHFRFPEKTVEPEAKGHPRESLFDVVLGRTIDASDRFELERTYGRRGVYGFRKRELLYRERRDLGLLPLAET